MRFKWFKCLKCEKEYRTRNPNPTCCEVGSKALIKAPETTFKEYQDEHRGKKRLVNQEQILRERARKHVRQHELHDLVQMNPPEEAIKNNWIKADGTTRKAIDDL